MNNLLLNKECKKCKENKPIIEFSTKDRTIDRYNSWCKKCVCDYAKTYYQNNKEKQMAYIREYQKNNPDKIKQYSKKWRDNNKKNISIRLKKYYMEWKRRDPEGYLAYKRKYKREWDRKAMLDPMHRLSNNMRGGMYHALKGKKGFHKWESLIGYTLQDLINHIDPLLINTTMNWNNYGTEWHIDHITPKSWFKYTSTDDPKFRECWSLSNLQPKPKLDNIRKGNKYIG